MRIFEILNFFTKIKNARSYKKYLGPIGLAVLTFIGYKQTDRQAKLMYRCKTIFELKIIKYFQCNNPKALFVKTTNSCNSCPTLSVNNVHIMLLFNFNQKY